MDKVLKCCWVCKRKTKKVKPEIREPGEVVVEWKGGWRESSGTKLEVGNNTPGGMTARQSADPGNTHVVAALRPRRISTLTANKPLNQYIFPRVDHSVSNCSNSPA